MDADRLRRAMDRLVYLPSLREGNAAGPSSALAAIAAAAAVSRERRQGGAGTGISAAPLPPRPWDRNDFYRRAATFRPSTWFAKDAATAGALVAAARGWCNVGLDLLRCEFCGEKLAATVATAATAVTATATTGGAGNNGGEESEKNSFASRLVSCHAAACPWRTGPACDLDALAQFPPLTRKAAESDFRAREAAALALDVLPPLSRASYELPARVAPSRLEALLQLGPRPAGGEEEDEEAEAGEAPEPPVLLLPAGDAPEGGGGDGSRGSTPSPAAAVARHGGTLHLRMCRLVALFGWSAEIVAPGVAKAAADRAAEAERRWMKAAVEEAERKRKRKGVGGGGGGGGSEADGTELLPPLWPRRPLPARPPASAMPAGSVRACDAALRCEACGATAGLWSFVPSELCGSGGGGEGEEKGGGGEAAAADNDSTPPAAKRAKGGAGPSPSSGWSPSSSSRKATAAAAATAATPGPSRPRELDLVSLHRAWCPFVDPSPLDEERGRRPLRRRVGWRWTLAALIPAVAGDDEAGEGDARLLRLEEEEGGDEGGEGGAGRAGAGAPAAPAAAAAAAAAAASPASSERATDRLRAVLARAGIVSPAAATVPFSPPPPPSHSFVN